ncbi:hypothetical protein GPECTOR_58g534 [Gonium pectorale]|uniref:Uncharacterized protein n=1 Tax=Gonium pectorale TaxID=33097 RepID=A0A150G5C5_GONPE|nr:hypothetical protein GPECTOR_58g534 [Gonium pectorale]|eukprot:KXZ45086.1 hypothetical protein GPECTOR_58g534 [Gonium pectorale]
MKDKSAAGDAGLAAFAGQGDCAGVHGGDLRVPEVEAKVQAARRELGVLRFVRNGNALSVEHWCGKRGMGAQIPAPAPPAQSVSLHPPHDRLSSGDALSPLFPAAALPLSFGDSLVGVLYITADAGDVSSVSCGGGAGGAARTVLSSPAALQQLALSASLALSALVASIGPGCGTLSALAASLRRIAESSSLQALVWELRDALAQYVRRQFLLDAAVQAAVVPQPFSRVAFMLHTDGPPVATTAATAPQPPPSVTAAVQHAGRGGGGGAANGLVLTASVGSPIIAAPGASLDGYGHAGQSGSPSKNSSTRHRSYKGDQRAADPLAAVGERSASQVMARRGTTGQFSCSPGPSSAGNLGGPKAPWAALGGGAAPRRSQRVFQLGPSALPGAGGDPTAAAAPPESASTAVFGGGGAAGGLPRNSSAQLMPLAPLVPSLRAKAFQLDHTVIQQMASARSEDEELAGVYLGAQIPNCARWVQDVRQPSRDVYLVMALGICSSTVGSGGAEPATGGGGNVRALSTGARSHSHGAGAASAAAAALGTGGGGSTNGAAGCGGSGGGSPVRSLALLGMDAGGGAMLGLYLGFATQLPPQLLSAIASSCGQLLHKVSKLVRAKLQGDLANELATVVAGVPGSYASFAPPPPPPTSELFTALDFSVLPPGGHFGLGGAAAANAAAAATVPTTADAVTPSRLARTTTMASCDGLPTAGDGRPQRAPAGRPRVPQLLISRHSGTALPPIFTASSGGGGGGLSPQARTPTRLTESSALGIGEMHAGGAAAAGGGGGGGVPFLLRAGSSIGATMTVLHDELAMSQDVVVDMGALTSVLTVHEVDGGSSMRAQMGLLVDAVMGTLRVDSNLLSPRATLEDARKGPHPAASGALG